MSRVGHFWIPSNPPALVRSDTGMTIKDRPGNSFKGGVNFFFTAPAGGLLASYEAPT